LVVYFILFLISRHVVTRKHRAGIISIKRGQVDAAIAHFQESYVFFNDHKILNNYIGPLFSISKATYKEMALLNMAYCYLQKKDGLQAKRIYEQTLSEFPNSMLARNTLTTFEAMKNVE